jgi:hypothetical protein
MNSNDIITCLGKSEDTPEVQNLLNAVGVTKKLKMPRDDIEARADLPKLGLSLIFKPEKPKSSLLVFYAVQFFSDAEKGYISFAGTLPSHLLLTDTQSEVRGKLGKPSETKAALRLDRWKQSNYVLTIEYSKESLSIGVITVHIPIKG